MNQQVSTKALISPAVTAAISRYAQKGWQMLTVFRHRESRR